MTVVSVSEIFHSLQGETTRSGFPTVFIRLAGCNLTCGYCDTKYAWENGRDMTIDEIVRSAWKFKCKLVEITGGEPLDQPGTVQLCEKLISDGYQVMVETNGTKDISALPKGTVRIIDMKTPDSGEEGSFHYPNLKHLDKNDEIKFVICSKNDFEWAVREITDHGLLSICPINISPVSGLVGPEEAAKWILETGKPLRLNLQLHKIIWGDKPGV